MEKEQQMKILKKSLEVKTFEFIESRLRNTRMEKRGMANIRMENTNSMEDRRKCCMYCHPPRSVSKIPRETRYYDTKIFN